MNRSFVPILLVSVLWLFFFALFAVAVVLSANRQTARSPDMVRVSEENGVGWTYWWDRNSDTCYLVRWGTGYTTAMMAWAPHTACEAQP